MKIELVDALPELENEYRKQVQLLIDKKLITLKEWNTKYKNYRDSYGYSILNYFSAYLGKGDIFMTTNEIMLDNRDELTKKFSVKILTPGEALKEMEDEA